MTEDQFLSLMEYIDARIDEKIYEYSGWDVLAEAIRTRALRIELRETFGLPPV